MNELSLFSGAGGGLLATKHLLGWNTIGYVEFNEYCQAVLAQRIEDGYLDPAPIFGDIKQFLREGYAEAYKGLVDVISAGFPCQPFSVAGKQKGEQDERNMWPSTWDAIRIIRPKYVMLENVPGLLNHGYIWQIYGDLAGGGYDMQWAIISAKDVGAPHLRKRWFCLATNTQEHWDRRTLGNNPKTQKRNWSRTYEHKGLLRKNWHHKKGRPTATPNLLQLAHGVAHRVDRLKAIGNGQVPEVVRTAWKVLSEIS